MEDIILKFDNVSVGYSKKSNIVKDFTTEIKKGCFVSIIGQNGSGKSTILKSIFGLVVQNQGDIFYEGKNIKEYRKKELAKHISFVPQIATFPADVTVKEFVEMGRFPYGNILTRNKSRDDEMVLDAIREVNLQGFENKFISELSGGQQQRALIALALAQDTETIILDEPTNHLDIKMQLEIMSTLHELNHKTKKTIIVVVHDINHGLRFSDKVIIMKDGMKLVEGRTNDIINESNVEVAFGVTPKIMESDGKKIIYDYWVNELPKLGENHQDNN